MIKLLLFVAILTTACPDKSVGVSTAEPKAVSHTNYNEVDLRINGIGLRTPYSEILEKVGTPLKTDDFPGQGYGCYGPSRKLSYDGMTIVLKLGEDNQTFASFSFSVNSPKWRVADGVSVGSSKDDVQLRFGEPLSRNVDAGSISWVYINKSVDGTATFGFKGDRVDEIDWESGICTESK